MVDFMTAQEARLGGMKDPEVLALAAEQKRILVSHYAGTMPTHFKRFREAANSNSGFFLIPQNLEVEVAIEELLLIWLVSDAAERNNRLEWPAL